MSRFAKSTVWNGRNLSLLLLMVFTMILPFLVYFDVFNQRISPRNPETVCLVDKSYRVSCGKQNITRTACMKLFCCFEIATNSCYHSEPSNFYYRYDENKNVYVPSQSSTPLGEPSLPQLMITKEETDRLKILLDATQNTSLPDNPLRNFRVVERKDDKLSITVFRKNTKEMLLTTVKGPLTASQRYIEWTLQLTNTSGSLFGLGQLKIDLSENTTLTKTIYRNRNDHNTLPIFMAYNSGKYHAVIIHHEGALQVTVLPSYLIVLRCIGGRNIGIDLIDGPTPKEIYRKISVKLEDLPPEWSFGLHICREEPSRSMDKLLLQYQEFVERRKMFPTFKFASDCIHDDLLLHFLASNSTATEVKDIIKKFDMKEKFLLSFPPQIPISSGLYAKYEDTKMFFMNGSTVYKGRYKGFDVVYPDYKHKAAEGFVTDIRNIFYGITIDGLVLTNSWPQDDNYHPTLSNKSFIQQTMVESIAETLPWNLRDSGDFHVRYHNDYALNFRKIVGEVFHSDFVVTPVSDWDSNGALIVQNVTTSWSNFKTTITTNLHNSLFGKQLIGSPICGSDASYNQKYHESLCLRWYLMAATMPLLHVSSEGVPRDPINLNTNFTTKKVLETLKKRYSLIPYYRTTLLLNGPLVRPMFYDFPLDERLHYLDEQYMLGGGILVAQPTIPNLEILRVFLPSNLTWYELWGGFAYRTRPNEEWISIPIFDHDWISFVAEGEIVAFLEDFKLKLVVALNCQITCKASGFLLIQFTDTDDELVEFSATSDNVTIKADRYVDKVKGMISSICFYKYDTAVCHEGDITNHIV